MRRNCSISLSSRFGISRTRTISWSHRACGPLSSFLFCAQIDSKREHHFLVLLQLKGPGFCQLLPSIADEHLVGAGTEGVHREVAVGIQPMLHAPTPLLRRPGDMRCQPSRRWKIAHYIDMTLYNCILIVQYDQRSVKIP